MGCALLLVLATAPTVRVDPSVELFSIIFRLAGNPEYNHRTSRSPYAKAVDKHFAAHEEHAVVQRARKLRSMRGISFDAVMSLAVHANEDFLTRPEWLEKRWKFNEAVAFLKLARNFRADSGFDRFYAAHSPLYAAAVSRFEGLAKKDIDLPWFDPYFGGKPKGKTTITLGMLNGSMNYGVRNTSGLTPVLGMSRWRDDGVPEPGPQFVPLVIHEIAHSHVNPIVDASYRLLEDSAHRLFFANEDVFRKQAYTTPKIVMYESIVRAVVQRYLQSGNQKARLLAQDIEDRRLGFVWTSDLAKTLSTWPASSINGIASKFHEYAAKCPPLPLLVRREPAGELDPSVRELRFVFDQKMKNGTWSMMFDGGEPFPKIDGKIRYSKDGTTLIVPVLLKSRTIYRFWLNREDNYGFRSERGMPLTPVRIKITTGPAAE